MATRVLWVVKGLGPGGAEHLLVAAAQRHDPQRFTIECAYVLPWKDHLVGDLEAAGVRTRCLSSRRSDPTWPLQLAELVRGGEYDIVHVHSPLPGSVARLAVRSMPAAHRPAIVSTEHNRWQTHRLPTRTLNRWTSEWDAADVAVTDEVRDSMEGAAGQRATVLRHGVDLDAIARLAGERLDVRAEFGIGPDEIVIGTVANFRPQKDYPNLLRAARQLLDTHAGRVRLLAVGQGPQEDEIRALHATLGLGDAVILTGFRADATRLMAACDVFTMASQWEGLPVAVMEALALGLPIVATDVGGMREQFSDGVDAVLVPPRDAAALAAGWSRVIDDPSLRARLADASRDRAREFGVERTVEALESIYARVAPKHSHTGEPPADAGHAGAPWPPPTPAGTATAAPDRSAKRPSGPPLDIRPATGEDRADIIALLQRSLGSDGDPRYPDLFAWKHDTNRFGRSPMWVATDEGRVVAFRALMRWEFVRGGAVLRAVRAVDTATDPDYQGRGLFKKLTLHGLEEVRLEGVDFVFNTPNTQSRPGYLKMGWREVGRLPAAVRFTGARGAWSAVRSRVPADRWSVEIDIGQSVDEWLAGHGPDGRWPAPRDVREIRTNADREFLAWRFGTPLLAYRVVDDGDAAVICRARRRGDALELAVVAAFGDGPATDRLATAAAREAGASYAIRLGHPQRSSSYVPLPGGGPVLTWRAVNDLGEPPLSNWALTLGDIELF